MASLRVDCCGIHIGHRSSNIIRWTAACLFGILTACLLFLQRYLGTICLVLFIYFVLSFALRAHTDPFSVSVRIAGAVLIFSSTAFITLVPWVIFGGKEECQASRGTSLTPWNQGFEDHWLDLSLRLIFIWLLAMHTIYINLGDHPPSAHTRQAVRCITFVWCGKLIHIVTVATDCCQVPEYIDGIRPADAEIGYFSVFGLGTHYVADVWFLQLVVERLIAFQAAYGELLPWTTVVLWLSRLLIFMVTVQAFGIASRYLALGNAIVLSVGVLLLAVLLCRAYAVPYRYLLQAQKLDVNHALSTEMKKETTFAMHLIWKSQIGIFLGICGMSFAFITFGLDFYILPRDKAVSMIYVVASNVDSLAITASLVMLSGVNFKWCRCKPKSNKKPSEDLQHFCWNFERTATRMSVEDEDVQWQKKVADLAMRRVSVELLLRFYLQLGDKDMTHFDPERSTTNDVVRHVVIPQSREGQTGRSFAEKFGPKTASMMPKMVTHHWSNRFCDLVAAVLADALGLKRWDLVAERLKRSDEDLKEELYSHGALQWQYWICAFCINQHASICGNSMGVLDTVTGKVLPCCDCETAKYLNDQPVQCEMNKFDDMMAYLHRNCDTFLQVVAIDLHFQIFSRAWCVAELVQADASQLDQHMIIHSPNALEKNSGELKSIQVQDCSASREEDKLAILGKIGRKEEVEKFNQRLQQILLGNGGLLADWLDGQKLLQELGAISARAKARVEEAELGVLEL